MPKVSVIIPNYNHANYLVERIESVLNQTYTDFELIILDDCSTDNSRQVIERYRCHPKVSNIVLNEQNSGTTFRQWERGFGLAQGEYIWLAESDDFAEPTLLEECMAQLDNDPQLAICYCDSNFVDDHSEKIDSFHLEYLVPKDEGAKTEMTGLEFIRRRLLKHNYIYNASMAIFRKSAIEQTTNSYKGFKGCGDWVFWAEIAASGGVTRISKRLNNFRQHSNKVSTKMATGRVDKLESAEALSEILNIYTSNARNKVAKRTIFKCEVNTIYTIIKLINKTRRVNCEKQIVERIERLRARVKREYRWYSVRAVMRLISKTI